MSDNRTCCDEGAHTSRDVAARLGLAMSCCGETNCRRKQPVLIRRGPFSGQWLAITRYRQDGDLIVAQEKHTLPGVSQAEIELAGSVLQDLHAHVKAQYEAEGNVNAERAYRDVLDKLAALAKAKETALLGMAEGGEPR